MSFQYVPWTDDVQSPKRTPKNRRAYVRYQCGPATPGRLKMIEGQEWQRVWVLDMSLGGVGLLLSRPLEIRQTMVLHLRSDSQKKTYQVSAHVAHVSRQADGDWIIGCEFEEQLTPELLDALL